MYINTFKYKPEDVSCVLCTEYVKKLGCTALSCPCLAERMEAGTVGYAEAVAELFPYRPRLTARIMRLAESFPGTMWQDDAHRKRMETLRLLLGCRKERDTPEFFAALYLLTSNKELADRTFNCFFRGGIDFRYARRRGISSHDYAGYIPADNPCCPGERCCEYAERIEREYTAEREADEDNEDADVFEYDGEPAISELTGVCRDILTAVEGLTSLLRDEFDYAG